MELGGLEPPTSWVRFRPEGTNRHQWEMKTIGRVVHRPLFRVSLCQSCAKDEALRGSGLQLGQQRLCLGESGRGAQRREQLARRE
jgi:hypothetical protein